MFHSCFLEYVFVLNNSRYYSHFLVLPTSVNSRLTHGTKADSEIRTRQNGLEDHRFTE